MSIARFAALTEENIDIIRQRGFNIVYNVFSLISFVSSVHFYFFIRNTRDSCDSVNF